MLCDRCHKREAKIYYTEISNNEKKEQYLCAECASECTSFQLESAALNKDLSIGGLLSSIMGNYYGNQPSKEENKKVEITCKQCGLSYDEFIQEGKFGCAGCYKSFGKTLERSIKQIQGASTHVGKKPIGYVSTTSQIVKDLSEIDLLSLKLQEAIEKEEFEEAVKLRDEIRMLKKEEAKNA